MKDIKMLLLLAVLCAVITSCGEHCPAMNDKMISLVPYVPKAQIQFVNEREDTLTFTVGNVYKNIEKYTMTFGNKCICERDIRGNMKSDNFYNIDISFLFQQHVSDMYYVSISLNSTEFSQLSGKDSNMFFYHKDLTNSDTFMFLNNDHYIKIVRNKGITEIKDEVNNCTWILLEGKSELDCNSIDKMISAESHC
ncbi:MAG: hypothetical protein LBF01_04565 [Bacteroidales bacterium]|jgi:hypothetical protein|nr:hypothetical protein [Bacteroidales bacterium]